MSFCHGQGKIRANLQGCTPTEANSDKSLMLEMFQSLMTLLRNLHQWEFFKLGFFSWMPKQAGGCEQGRAGTATAGRLGGPGACDMLFGGRHGGWTGSADQEKQIVPPPWLRVQAVSLPTRQPGDQTSTTGPVLLRCGRLPDAGYDGPGQV